MNLSQTNYFVVVGPNTAFPADRSVTIQDFPGLIDGDVMITDDPATMALVIESATRTTNWLEPNDILIDEVLDEGNFQQMLDECSDRKGIGVAFVDRKYIRVSVRPSAEDLRSMWTIQGGEFLDRDSLRH